jgi:hypothetical protein
MDVAHQPIAVVLDLMHPVGPDGDLVARVGMQGSTKPSVRMRGVRSQPIQGGAVDSERTDNVNFSVTAIQPFDLPQAADEGTRPNRTSRTLARSRPSPVRALMSVQLEFGPQWHRV